MRRKIRLAWNAMLARCSNKNHPNYKQYGQRGIYVCKDWENFDCFYSWAINNGVAEGLTIDRIDNDGPYSPKNCRWTTRKEQAKNRSTGVWIKFNGERLSQREWAKRLGISDATLWHRLKHWSLEDALTRPKSSGQNRFKARSA